ncbi:hypothetical protein AB4496_29215, partial [Vibrio sp. 10N.222.46.A1]
VLASSDTEIPVESNIKNLKIDPIHINESFDSPAANHKRFTPMNTQRSHLNSPSKKRITEQALLVIQVSFLDEQIENDFQSTIFGENQQSVQDYFLKNSYGNYKVVPAKENEGTKNDGVINITLDI